MAFSTVAIGTRFENHALKFLNHHLHMSLTRVGRAGDQGIDLRGWWWLPSGTLRAGPSSSSEGSGMDNTSAVRKGKGRALPEEDMVRIRVVAQCKALSVKTPPRDVRELEGVMAGLKLRQLSQQQADRLLESEDDPGLDSHLGTIAILVSQSGFSRDAVTRALNSPAPMMLIHLPGGRTTPSLLLDGIGEGGHGMQVNGCLWNHAMQGDKGLFSSNLALRREILSETEGDEEGIKVKEQWRCWYDGMRLDRVGPSLEQSMEERAHL
ncbi:hypothetical protein BD324DRAFT_680670 [Kockovaella imperatae]|uniref:Restriction endonuclease type IV Mrr domain-containing protein n=1 Tax=Kockovaella imperatae TaxID=4999 RepID=A0A1Y1UIA4_9TREE|nr:hypothetical protein BD324DRAFT_680670 [Kockovaella imperatae]ORX37790.1 hypothetical protein BD324DRAFT_680670 [Kockovaella imperatae]